MLFLILTTLAFAEDVWTTVEAPSKRFPDADIAGPTFPAMTQLTVLVREPERLRVTDGDKYGWVAAEDTTTTAPPTLDPSIEELIRSIDLGGAAPGGARAGGS